ncbi:related to C6 transcription factor [Phialocephala subalpina]|uniref:Related to C6 transcription factor n=1 Tax=Phialocephala subalpina TaxID=576137 RepID=A0A1L7XHX0_9HELO|nr:related to C6 transcription factor [Phialocephala subalpina]
MTFAFQTSRRAHHKRRTGCQQCKNRRVKCGEERASCRNCLKRKLECSFVLNPPEVDACRLTHLNPDGTRFHRQPMPRQAPSSSVVDLVDHELLHHFITTTCLTFSSSVLIQRLWQTTAPQIGLGHDFVLHAILAVSGLHLARLKPEKRASYTVKAIAHHRASSQIAIPLMSNVDSKNVSSLFLFSVLTSFFALASPQLSGPNSSGEDFSPPAWLFLMQGTRRILHKKSEAIKLGSLGPMLISVQEVKLYNAPPAEGEGLRSLENLIIESAATGCLDLDAAESCSGALRQLANLFTVAYLDVNNSDHFRQVLAWTLTVPDAYITLVRNRVPEAICIFAYYCVILKTVETSWLMEGWSAHLISSIHSILDERYREYIRWPARELGWVPI